MRQLDTENDDRDLTSQVTVLTHTPDASNPCMCMGLVYFGDGAKDLDGTGGDFELTITVGSQTVEPDPQTIEFSTATRTSVFTLAFPVPANTEVILKAKSPNGADTDVDVTAYLYDVGPLQPTSRGTALDVSATGESGLDFDNIKDATGAHTLTNITVPTVTDVSNQVTAAAVKTAIEAGGSSIAQILADTNELQTDDIPASLGTIAGYLDTEIAAILTDTGTTLEGHLTDIKGSGFAKDTHSLPQCLTAADADIKTQVVAALNSDSYAEPGQGAPPATATLVQKIGYLFKNWRNKKTQDASTWELYADDTTTVDQKATVSDDGTDFTKTEVATGP